MINNPKKFIIRSDTTEEWKKNNPILRLGEIVADTTLHKIKIGDGVNRYLDLPYQFNELYIMIDAIIRLISNIGSNGSLLDSVNTYFELTQNYRTTKINNLCFVVDEGLFYQYTSRGWKPVNSSDDDTSAAGSNKKSLVDIANTVDDLYNPDTYPANTEIGTQVYVVSDEHFYFYNGSRWVRISNSNDVVVSSVISLSEL